MAGTLDFTSFAKQKGLDPKLPATDAAYKQYLAALPNASKGQKAQVQNQAAAPTRTPGGMPTDAEIIAALGGGDLKDTKFAERFNTAKTNYQKKIKDDTTRGSVVDTTGNLINAATNPIGAFSDWLNNLINPKGAKDPTVSAILNPVGTMVKGVDSLLHPPLDTKDNVYTPAGIDQELKKPGTGVPLTPEEYFKSNKLQNDAVGQQRYKEYLDLFKTDAPKSGGKGGLKTVEPPPPLDREDSSIPVQGPLPEEKAKPGLWDTIMNTINTGPVHDIVGLLQNAVEHRTASLQNRRVDFDKDTIIGRDRLEKLKQDEQNRQYDWQRQLQQLNQDFLANQALENQGFQGTEADKQRKAVAALQAQSDAAAMARTLENKKGSGAGRPNDPLGVRTIGAMK